MKPSEAQSIVTMMATAWPDGWRFLSDEQQADTRKLWRNMLADLDYQVADAALRRLIGTKTRQPSIAEFRATCSSYTEGRRSHGGEAWGALLKMIGRYGANRTPLSPSAAKVTPPQSGDEFAVGDPVLFRVIESMGWRELCLSENSTADRARFIELYDKLSQEAAVERSVATIAPPIPERQLRAGAPASLADTLARVLPEAKK